MPHTIAHHTPDFDQLLVDIAEYAGIDVGDALMILACQGLETYAATISAPNLRRLATFEYKRICVRFGFAPDFIQAYIRVPKNA